MTGRLLPILLAALAAPAAAAAQEATVLRERFDPAEATRAQAKVVLSGRIALPATKTAAAQTLPLSGGSTVVYDERPLPSADDGSARVVRLYRDVGYKRTLGDRAQEADVRPAVRRMVVLRSERGKKAPFSPDGPLTWNEIDVVRTDLFAPALVPALLPAEAVRPGSEWKAGPAAVAELTDFDPVESGEVRVRFEAVVTMEGRSYARLGLTGSVQGTTEDGPARQRLDGTAYFDLAAARLASLNIRGARELLGPDGQVTGRIEGQFTLTRSAAGRAEPIGDDALRGLALSPGADNTLLLYDEPDFGARFLYPRRWRVAKVQGRQLTLEEPRGAGMLITLEAAEKLPTAGQYLAESRGYLEKTGARAVPVSPPAPWPGAKMGVERFRFDAEFPGKALRLEYAVASGPNGGALLAARWRRDEPDGLASDFERVLRSLEVVRK